MKSVRIAGLVVAGFGLLAFSSAAAVRSRVDAVCHASTVQYRTAKPTAPGVAGPWVASTNSAFRGYLFYFGTTRWGRAQARVADIFTPKAHARVHPKVLWVALGEAGPSLVIKGTQLDGPGSFTARYPATATGSVHMQFPSYVSVPTAGCWRVSLLSGSLHGSVTFIASDTA